MQIESGSLYMNKTWLYLYPCLKFYGEELRTHLNAFLKIAVGISDHNLNIANINSSIYILIDTEPKYDAIAKVNYKTHFSDFLDWVKYQPYYVTDYVFEELKYSGKHMVVLKLPSKHEATLLSFIQGRYSGMYSKAELDLYFKLITHKDKDHEIKHNARVKKVLNVLTRNKECLEDFVKDVNKRFATTVTVEDFKDAEIDYPPVLEEETFNL